MLCGPLGRCDFRFRLGEEPENIADCQHFLPGSVRFRQTTLQQSIVELKPWVSLKACGGNLDLGTPMAEALRVL